MTYDREPRRIGYNRARLRWGVQTFVSKALALMGAAVLFAGAVALSIVAFAVIVAAVLVVGIYLWWKTRDLRKRMHAASRDSSVIDGEIITRVVRDVEPHDRD